VILIEDKASGTQLIQELREAGAPHSVSFCGVMVERTSLLKWLTSASIKAPGLREADVTELVLSEKGKNLSVSIDKIVKLIQSKDPLFPRERIREIAHKASAGRRYFDDGDPVFAAIAIKLDSGGPVILAKRFDDRIDEFLLGFGLVGPDDFEKITGDCLQPMAQRLNRFVGETFPLGSPLNAIQQVIACGSPGVQAKPRRPPNQMSPFDREALCAQI
jgi:hypothetical protein